MLVRILSCTRTNTFICKKYCTNWCI